LASDPLNQLSQGEASLVEGTGSQLYTDRWGDYTHMTIDPTDGETFWYTNEYYITTGTNWQTRIGSFKFAAAPTPPDPPSNLTATAVGCNQIDLAWQDNSDNEDGFAIERSLDGTNFSSLTTVGADVTSFSDTTVAESTTYWYRVKAFNGAGDSAYSNVADATTPPCSGPPAAPSDLKGKQTGNNEITLKWVDNSDNEDAFIIYRGVISPASISASFYKAIAKVRPNTTTYVDQGIRPGYVYYYKVCAVNQYGESCSRAIRVPTQ
jgi:hypothetical protein